jgi:hypothetical protein
MRGKTRITVEQIDKLSYPKTAEYKVIKLTQRTEPKIGKILTQVDVDNLMNERETTVDVVPTKKQ